MHSPRLTHKCAGIPTLFSASHFNLNIKSLVRFTDTNAFNFEQWYSADTPAVARPLEFTWDEESQLYKYYSATFFPLDGGYGCNDNALYRGAQGNHNVRNFLLSTGGGILLQLSAVLHIRVCPSHLTRDPTSSKPCSIKCFQSNPIRSHSLSWSTNLPVAHFNLTLENPFCSSFSQPRSASSSSIVEARPFPSLATTTCLYSLTASSQSTWAEYTRSRAGRFTLTTWI